MNNQLTTVNGQQSTYAANGTIRKSYFVIRHFNMSQSKQSLGKWGESVAETHLQSKNFTILSKNWRCVYGEIDIVAQKGSSIHFVEVKTRKGRGKGSPEESITPKKAQKLMQAGLMYISQNSLGDPDWQIDLIAVELNTTGKLIRCEHLENFVTY